MKSLVVYFINFHFNNQKVLNEYNIHIDLNVEQRNFGKIRKQQKRRKELYDNSLSMVTIIKKKILCMYNKSIINMYNVIIIRDKIFLLLTFNFLSIITI